MTTVWQTFKRFVGLSPEIRTWLLATLPFLFIFELVKILPPFVFKVLIDHLLTYDPSTGVTWNLILTLLVGYLGSLSLTSILEIFHLVVLKTKITKADSDLTRSSISKLLRLDIGYHERRNTGAQLNTVFKGTQRFVDIMWHLADGFIPTCFQILFTLIALFVFSWQIGLSFLIITPIFLIILLQDSKRTQPLRKKLHESMSRAGSVAAQSMINIRTVKDFANEPHEDNKLTTRLKEYVTVHRQRTITGATGLLFEDFTTSIGRVTALGIGVWLMTRGDLTPGALVFVVTLTEKAYINMQRLYRAYYMFQDAEPYIDAFSAIQSEPSRITDNTPSTLMVKHGDVQFKNVTFSYTKGAPSISNISFTIPSRSVAALVGRSGGGKSTVVKLLMRHFDPDQGTVLIDGKPLGDYSLKHLRNAIGIVSQDVELFDLSIHDNIAYGQPGASRAEVIAAAKLANAHEFITGFKNGYTTIVGERGVRLSGGQKQRIGIARALLKKPKILIFDEATASLDAESERKIHQSITRLMGKMTMIIIAHRFSTIERAEHIILLDQGKIREIGTHQQLIAKKGIFSKLRRLQELGEVE